MSLPSQSFAQGGRKKVLKNHSFIAISAQNLCILPPFLDFQWFFEEKGSELANSSLVAGRS